MSEASREQAMLVSPDDAGERLDAWIARRDPAHSRARWQELIKSGHVLVNGAGRKANYAVRGGDEIRAVIPPPEDTSLRPEHLPLDVIFEDGDLIVINKPAGLVVHPAPGHARGTLVNALLHHCADLTGIGGEKRPGIVHRLDRDTTGVMVIAKNDAAMQELARQFKDRATRKEYIALVWGAPTPPRGTIQAAIGRDPVHRKKMSVRAEGGRTAVTHYRTIESLGAVAVIQLRIETGRTHQIRVHLAHIKHPVIGDAVYGRKRPPDLPRAVTRQMLHAWKLTITHPRSGETITFEAPWPTDIKELIHALGGQPR